MGLIDATIGWAISWAIGPGRTPDGTLPLPRWIAAAALVMLTASICAAVGGFGARFTASGPAMTPPPK
jgi:hypothetical protein